MSDELDVDPRTERLGVCGVTTIVNGREWVCIKQVHDDPPRPGHGQRSTRWDRHGITPRGTPTYPPRSERHYYVRRWPHSSR